MGVIKYETVQKLIDFIRENIRGSEEVLQNLSCQRTKNNYLLSATRGSQDWETTDQIIQRLKPSRGHASAEGFFSKKERKVLAGNEAGWEVVTRRAGHGKRRCGG